MTPEQEAQAIIQNQRQIEFRGRREKALKEIDAIMAKYQVGLQPVISYQETAIVPSIRVADTKNYEGKEKAPAAKADKADKADEKPKAKKRK